MTSQRWAPRLRLPNPRPRRRRNGAGATDYEYDDGSAGASGGWRSVGLGYIVTAAAIFLAVALLFIFA